MPILSRAMVYHQPAHLPGGEGALLYYHGCLRWCGGGRNKLLRVILGGGWQRWLTSARLRAGEEG